MSVGEIEFAEVDKAGFEKLRARFRGALLRPSEEGHREEGFDLNIVAAWPAPDPGRESHIAWVREGWDQMKPHGEGIYANFISDEGTAGVEAVYGERLGRLMALKDRYGPTNFVRLNANVPPSDGGAQ